MKIAFPLKKESEGANYLLADDFNEESYFGIYNTESGEISSFAPGKFEGDENTDFLEFLITSKVESIISPSMRTMALKLFRMNDIVLYKAMGYDLMENIQLYENNALPKLSMLNNTMNSGCSPSACDSCSGSCG